MAVEHKDINCKSNWETCSLWAAFMIPEGSMQADGEDRTGPLLLVIQTSEATCITGIFSVITGTMLWVN